MPPYEIRYFDSSGRQRWETIYGSLREAEVRRAELRLRHWRGEQLGPTERFDECARTWLERQEVRPRTREGYQWALECHLIPYFGERRLDQISCDDIAALIAVKRRAGLKGWTVTSLLRPLSMMLAQAARRGVIPVNPMTQLERRERPRHDDVRPKRVLTLAEMRVLLEHASDTQYRALFELLLTSGLRIGEALGLTAADLDQERDLVRVEYQLGRDGMRTRLKTPEARRTLDVPPQVMRQLAMLVGKRSSTIEPDKLVFASRTGEGLERKVAREALKRACANAQLTIPNPTLHDLRHSHASMLLALDVSIVDVQRRLGHRRPDTTLRIYAHEWKRSEMHKSRVGRQIGELFNAEG